MPTIIALLGHTKGNYAQQLISFPSFSLKLYIQAENNIILPKWEMNYFNKLSVYHIYIEYLLQAEAKTNFGICSSYKCKGGGF